MHQDLAGLKTNYAIALTKQGQYGQAETIYQEALDIYNQLPQAQQRALNKIACLKSFSMNLEIQEKYADAEKYLREAMNLLLSSNDDQFERRDIQILLSRILMKLGKTEEAKLLIEKSFTKLAHDSNNISTYTISSEDFLSNEAFYRQVLETVEELLEPTNIEIARYQHALAVVLSQLNRFVEAEPLYRKALDSYIKNGVNQTEVIELQSNTANVLAELGRYSEAEPLYQKVLEAHKNNHDDEMLIEVTKNRAKAAEKNQQYEQAEIYYKEALQMIETYYSDASLEAKKSIEQAKIKMDLGNVLVKLKRYSDAEECYNFAFCVNCAVYELEHPETLGVLNNAAILASIKGNLIMNLLSVLKQNINTLLKNKYHFSVKTEESLGIMDIQIEEPLSRTSENEELLFNTENKFSELISLCSGVFSIRNKEKHLYTVNGEADVVANIKQKLENIPIEYDGELEEDQSLLCKIS